MTFRVAWPDKPREGGDSCGYRAQSVETLSAAKLLGLVEDPSARVVVRVCSPAHFKRVDDRPHVLLTNWESPDLFWAQIEAANRADLVLVISEFCVEAFRRAIRPPVEYVPLGVETACVPVLRSDPAYDGRQFRWLWVGAPSHRKGWDRLIGKLDVRAIGGVWHERGWAARTDVELTMKWSEHGTGGKVVRAGNVTCDNRLLPRADLLALYASAHGFILPSYGEGFGLTLLEAMASGCPSVYTPTGGVAGFADGWPVEVDRIDSDPAWGWTGGKKVPVLRARLSSLDAKMRELMADYPASAARAFAIGQRLHREWTWERTARALLTALERHFPQHATASITALTTAAAYEREFGRHRVPGEVVYYPRRSRVSYVREPVVVGVSR